MQVSSRSTTARSQSKLVVFSSTQANVAIDDIKTLAADHHCGVVRACSCRHATSDIGTTVCLVSVPDEDLAIWIWRHATVDADMLAEDSQARNCRVLSTSVINYQQNATSMQ